MVVVSPRPRQRQIALLAAAGRTNKEIIGRAAHRSGITGFVSSTLQELAAGRQAAAAAITQLRLTPAANAVADQFANGAAFVSFETLTDTALIGETVARRLHVPTPPGQALRDSLLAFFGPRHLLLVLDNVEQLVSAAPLVEQFLELVPGLKMLATSRGPLRIRGEKVIAVVPLALPERGAPVDPGALPPSRRSRCSSPAGATPSPASS